MPKQEVSPFARAAGIALAILILCGAGWLFGRFSIDIVLVMFSGGAAIFCVYGWIFEAGLRTKPAHQIAIQWVICGAVWAVTYWLLDIHPWR